MTSQLTGPSLQPSNDAKPQRLVILLHGYGSSGDDLISLANYWTEALPDTEFLAPNAPQMCSVNPFGQGYQWFDLTSLDLSQMVSGIQSVLSTVNTYIDQELEKRQLTESDLALVGFSQGTMVALAVGLSRPTPCAGILGYSGAFIPDPQAQIQSYPPTFLIHGYQDGVILIDHMVESAKHLSLQGVPIQSHVCKGLAHSIDADGLALGGDFLSKHLNQNEGENKSGTA